MRKQTTLLTGLALAFTAASVPTVADDAAALLLPEGATGRVPLPPGYSVRVRSADGALLVDTVPTSIEPTGHPAGGVADCLVAGAYASGYARANSGVAPNVAPCPLQVHTTPIRELHLMVAGKDGSTHTSDLPTGSYLYLRCSGVGRAYATNNWGGAPDYGTSGAFCNINWIGPLEIGEFTSWKGQITTTDGLAYATYTSP